MWSSFVELALPPVVLTRFFGMFCWMYISFHCYRYKCYLIVSWVLSFLCKWSVSLSLLGFALQDLPSTIQPKGRQVNRASISLSNLYWLALFHTAFVLEIEWASYWFTAINIQLSLSVFVLMQFTISCSTDRLVVVLLHCTYLTIRM